MLSKKFTCLQVVGISMSFVKTETESQDKSDEQGIFGHASQLRGRTPKSRLTW